MGTSTTTFYQTGFRIRNDNGDETAATWRQDQNVADSLALDTNFRVRFLIDEQGGAAWSGVTFNLYYSLNGGSYAAVSGSTPVQFSLSDNFTDGADCTSQLSGGVGAFTSDNNGMAEAAGVVNSGAKNAFFECEWCLTLDSGQVVNTDYVDLRIYNGTGAIVSYTQTPRITAAADTTDELTATDVVSGVPTVDAATIGQKHVLTATDVASGIPAVDSATLGQIHALVSTDVSSGIPTIDKAALGQVHALTAQDVSTPAPVVDSATLGQVHALVSTDVVSGVPTVDKPTVGEVAPSVDALTATDVVAGVPTVDKPTLKQISKRHYVAMEEQPIIVDEDEEEIILYVMEYML